MTSRRPTGTGPGGAERENAYRDAAAPLLACTGRLAEEVGEPPTDRLRRLARDLASACERIERGARATAEVVADSRTVDRRGGKAALDAGGVAIGNVDARLSRRLLGSSDLPSRAETGGSWVDARLTAVARELTAGRADEVQCWAADEWGRLLEEGKAYTNGSLTIDTTGAYADYGDGVIAMQARDCESLAPFGDAAELVVADVVWPLQVLAHEIEHLTGTEDEALTECYGLQRHADVGRRLGFTASLARASASSYWEDWYPDRPASTRPTSAGRVARSISTPRRRPGRRADPDQPPMYDISTSGCAAVCSERSSE